jgi:hypothetical protein
VMTSEPDYGQLCPHLGWLPVDLVGCPLTPSRRCSSILLNSHACP